MSMKAAGSAVAAKPDCNLTGDMLIRSPWRDEYQGGGGIASGCPQEWIEKGIAAYQEVVSNNPGDADAHLKIGMLFLLIGNRRAAREEYKILRNLFPSMADELMRKWNITYPVWADEKKKRGTVPHRWHLAKGHEQE